MLTTLRDLGRNLASGALLVLVQPVSRFSFRINVAQLLLLFVVSASLDIAVEGLQAGPDAVFTISGVVSEAFFGAVLMVFAALLAQAFRQPAYALALPVVLLAGEWPLQVARLIIAEVAKSDASPAGEAARAGQVVLLWSLFWLWRSAAVSLAPARPYRLPRSLFAAVLLATPLWFGPLLLDDQGWWETPEQESAAATGYPSPASEEVLAKQPQLLYEALNDLEEERPGTTDLYFVGFASYAGEDVFRKDMDVARKLFDERFDTDGRSIVLVNNLRTVLDEPLATVSNLRETLTKIGASIDRDQDVVMLYVTSHGSRDHRISVDFPPLQLDALTPLALRKMLDDAGIKWRIIVISACYSGGFVEPLKDDYTLIMTAAASDRSSFGCGSESDATYFGDALFQHALRFEDSFVKAFDQARESIAARERRENMTPPSEPQIFVGNEMAAKLPKLEAELRARRSGTSI